MPRLRSWLFVPANREDRVQKAFASAADAVILDLEDACPEAGKEAARAIVERAAAIYGGPRLFARINGARTRYALGDLEGVAFAGLAGIVLPKAERLEDLHAVDWALGQLEEMRGIASGSIELIPLIETARGVADVMRIARCGLARVRRLTFGAGDLTTDMGVQWTRDEAELAHVRAAIVTGSRAAELEPPIDTVWPGISDADGMAVSAERSRSLGFGGKLLIHPSQIAPINAALTPTSEEVGLARRILKAAEAAASAGQGAFQLDGRLMDQVSVVRARRTLETYGEQE